MILLSQFNQPTMATTTWTYIGREGKAYLVTDGIRTKYLTAREFRQFNWA